MVNPTLLPCLTGERDRHCSLVLTRSIAAHLPHVNRTCTGPHPRLPQRFRGSPEITCPDGPWFRGGLAMGASAAAVYSPREGRESHSMPCPYLRLFIFITDSVTGGTGRRLNKKQIEGLTDTGPRRHRILCPYALHSVCNCRSFHRQSSKTRGFWGPSQYLTLPPPRSSNCVTLRATRRAVSCKRAAVYNSDLVQPDNWMRSPPWRHGQCLGE
ncbi:hypothetical protein LY76DRAFT_152833 [Colletotrichum caudatum]|nr:hypothetical protein LY76DRAFT_152833 [Colletotrichum caudatum]